MAQHNEERFKKIVNHPQRASIEFDLCRGVPPPEVARKYGCSRTAAYRHRRKLPPQLRAAKLAKKLSNQADLEALRVDESQGLLTSFAMQRARLLLAQDICLEAGDVGKLVFCAQAIHRNLELVGKYLGEFATHQIQTSISVLIQPEYLQLRAQLLNALKPFPEARRAVAEALHQTESQVASAPPPMIDAAPERPHAVNAD